MTTNYFFKLVDDNPNANELAFCATVDPLLNFNYPVKNLDLATKKQLKVKLPITVSQNELRIKLLKKLPICERFIHSIIAIHIIENEVFNYCDEKIKTLSNYNSMPLHEFVSVLGYWAEIYYQQQREKGNTHQAAVRSLAFKWILIVYRCWKTKEPYNEAKYLKALSDRNSPLLFKEKAC